LQIDTGDLEKRIYDLEQALHTVSESLNAIESMLKILNRRTVEED